MAVDDADASSAAAQRAAVRTTADVQALIAAERGGHPFVTGHMSDGRHVIFLLPRDRWRLTVGRTPDSDIALPWDLEVSRAHALLEQVGKQWTLVDDGLSSNGSFVNGRRVTRRQRLRQGDRLCFGKTQLMFRDPGPAESEVTRRETPTAVPLTPTQHRVLIELCRPLNDASSTLPATNRQIAEKLFLSVDAVKAQLRLLFKRFGLTELAQNEKRSSLAQAALRAGAVLPSRLLSCASARAWRWLGRSRSQPAAHQTAAAELPKVGRGGASPQGPSRRRARRAAYAL